MCIRDLGRIVEEVVAALQMGCSEIEINIARRSMKRFAKKSGDPDVCRNEMILLYAAMKAASTSGRQRFHLRDLREMVILVAQYDSMHARHVQEGTPLLPVNGHEESSVDTLPDAKRLRSEPIVLNNGHEIHALRERLGEATTALREVDETEPGALEFLELLADCIDGTARSVMAGSWYGRSKFQSDHVAFWLGDFRQCLRDSWKMYEHESSRGPKGACPGIRDICLDCSLER